MIRITSCWLTGRINLRAKSSASATWEPSSGKISFSPSSAWKLALWSLAIGSRERTVTLMGAEEQHDASMAPKILIADEIAQEGTDLLRAQLPEAQIDVLTGLKPEQLRTIIGEYAALIVRSATQVTADILAEAGQLKIVGRAGVGVDNIDTEAATNRGIMVVNSPTGNIVAAAEHTIAMLMSLARHVPAASGSTKAGKWEKNRFMGIEVRNKILGVIGLGKVGAEVTKRAQGLEMQVIAFDPYVSPEQARKLGVTMLTLDEVLQQADFITLHTSLTSGPNGTRAPIRPRVPLGPLVSEVCRVIKSACCSTSSRVSIVTPSLRACSGET